MQAAMRRARLNEDFWRLTFSTGGIGYEQLARMDAAAFREALAAYVLWRTEWNKSR